jgi:hypothetical protein
MPVIPTRRRLRGLLPPACRLPRPEPPVWGLEEMDTDAAQMDAVAGMLQKLGDRLQEPLSAGLRRELFETLVEQVRVDTRQEGTAGGCGCGHLSVGVPPRAGPTAPWRRSAEVGYRNGASCIGGPRAEGGMDDPAVQRGPW